MTQEAANFLEIDEPSFEASFKEAMSDPECQN